MSRFPKFVIFLTLVFWTIITYFAFVEFPQNIIPNFIIEYTYAYYADSILHARYFIKIFRESVETEHSKCHD